MCRGKFPVGPCNCSGGIKLTKMSSNVSGWQAVATDEMYSQPAGEQLNPVRSLCSQQTANFIKRGVSKPRPLVGRKMRSQSSPDRTSSSDSGTLPAICPVEERLQSSPEFSCKSNDDVQIDQRMLNDLIPVTVSDDVLHSKHTGVYHSVCECLPSHSKTLMQEDHPLPLYDKLLPVNPESNHKCPPQAPAYQGVSHSPVHSTSKLCLNAIIPSPVLDEALDTDVEYRIVNLPGEHKELVTEKVDTSGLSDSTQTNLPCLSPLKLTYVAHDSDDSDASSSMKSVIDLDSINLCDDSSSDVGPDLCIVYDKLPNKQEVGFEVIRRTRSIHKCSSLQNINRHVHIYNDEIFSLDVANDVGPEPKVLIDCQRAAEQEMISHSVETTGEQNITDTGHRPGLHGAWSQVTGRVNSEYSSDIIDSIFSPKKVYSCCKNRRRSSWNGGGGRRRNAQLKLVCNWRPRKIVVIGDMCTGKSALISAYCNDRFSDMYVPTILRSCQTDAEMGKEKIELVVIEVSGREDYSKLRKCAYRKSDALILCYSSDNISSLEKIKSYWLPEIQKYASNTPFILVGTKKDNREEILYQVDLKSNKRNLQTLEDSVQSKKGMLVSTEQGYEMSQFIGAHCFLECSARYRDGTRHVFETVTKIAVKKSRRKRKIQRTGDVCSIM